jgi:hypothetical protein
MWLGNLSESDHRAFARHILNRPNDKRPYAYPKVTMKTIFFVLISCYSAKEWIECRKKKQLVKRELNRMNLRLQLFKANGEFWPEKRKLFKKNYNITSATMQVLLETPREEFFSSAQQTQNKNKTVGQLSPYAKEFIQIFLKRKLDFRKPAGRAFFRPYNDMNVKLGPWPIGSWSEAHENLKLGIIDFMQTPNFTSLQESFANRPYFLEFVTMLQR